MDVHLTNNEYGTTKDNIDNILIILNNALSNEKKYKNLLEELKINQCNVMIALLRENNTLYFPFNRSIFTKNIKNMLKNINFYDHKEKFDCNHTILFKKHENILKIFNKTILLI